MLLAEDDYPLHQSALPLAHVMDGHPNAYDRFWFNGYTEDFMFAVALGLYPNKGLIDAAFSITRNGVQRCVFAGDVLHGRPTSVGPVRIEILEPMRASRVVVDAPEQGLRADLTFSARTEAFEEPRQTMHDGPRIFMDVTRATQLGTWTGWIETPEEGIEIAPETYGVKDRSWGVRPLGDQLPGAPGTRAPQLCFMWAPINFADRGVHVMTFDDHDGRALSRTAVELPLLGQGDPAYRDGSFDVQSRAGTRQADAVRITLGDDEITLTPLFTFQMRGVGYSSAQYPHGRWHGGPYQAGEVLQLESLDPTEFQNIHVEQVVRAEWNGRRGLGVFESLIIGPYEPMGISGLFDGA